MGDPSKPWARDNNYTGQVQELLQHILPRNSEAPVSRPVCPLYCCLGEKGMVYWRVCWRKEMSWTALDTFVLVRDDGGLSYDDRRASDPHLLVLLPTVVINDIHVDARTCYTPKQSTQSYFTSETESPQSRDLTVIDIRPSHCITSSCAAHDGTELQSDKTHQQA